MAFEMISPIKAASSHANVDFHFLQMMQSVPSILLFNANNAILPSALTPLPPSHPYQA